MLRNFQYKGKAEKIVAIKKEYRSAKIFILKRMSCCWLTFLKTWEYQDVAAYKGH